jgi:hypothetical protein
MMQCLLCGEGRKNLRDLEDHVAVAHSSNSWVCWCGFHAAAGIESVWALKQHYDDRGGVVAHMHEFLHGIEVSNAANAHT